MISETEIRTLTDKGVDAFREYLNQLREDAGVRPPFELLTDAETSQSLGGGNRIAQRRFDTRLGAAWYLDDVLSEIETGDVEDNTGLWSWLSLFYFDQVCPPNRAGRRKPGRDYRHILEPGYPNGHRHLLSGAYLVYTIYGLGKELSLLLLSTPPSIESKFCHELAGRQSLITNEGIMAAASRLYLDPSTGKPKRGARAKKGDAPGTLYRFIDVVQQLDVNYDLYSMTGDEIIGILPDEFDRWKGQGARRHAP